MKRFIAVLGFFLLFLSFLSFPVSASHQIAYFRDNKAGAVSVTFDDGYQSQITTGVPQLNARGLKGTFFVITGDDVWINTHVPWATWQVVAGQGHEIGSHTVTHPDLTALSGAALQTELSVSQITINQEIPGQSCISLDYPGGSTNATVQSATATYYAAGRATWAVEGGVLNHYSAGSDMYGAWQPINFYDVGSQGVDVSGSVIQPSNLGTILDVAALRHAWACFHLHEVQNGPMFGQFLDLVLTKNVWVDTLGNIARYMKERLNSTIQVVNDTTSEIRLRIVMNASLPTATYNVPLTLRSTVPYAWFRAHIQQGSSSQTVIPVIEGSDAVVYYNAVPNGGDVVLTEEGTGNPVPVLTSLDPSSASVGTTGFYIMVYGRNFVPGAALRWSQMTRRTTYISPTQLRAWVMPSDVYKARTWQVWVTNPAPGGGDSNVLFFTVK